MTADLMRITIHVGLRRLPRNRCGTCKKRRVLFIRTVNREPSGVALCAICAGFSVSSGN